MFNSLNAVDVQSLAYCVNTNENRALIFSLAKLVFESSYNTCLVCLAEIIRKRRMLPRNKYAKVFVKQFS